MCCIPAKSIPRREHQRVAKRTRDPGRPTAGDKRDGVRRANERTFAARPAGRMPELRGGGSNPTVDCAERYRNEEAVGEAMQEVFKTGAIRREDVFVTTKLWNTNHRPERVKPAFDASRRRLQIDYADCYLIHTPFAFRPGDEQDPRDERGQVIYDSGVTLVDTWRALRGLGDAGRCRSIGLSDITLEKLREIVAAARIKPAVVQVESHPYLPEWDLLELCRTKESYCWRLRRWDTPWSQVY